MHRPYRIIDISQPVSSRTACFPGDTPFSRQVTVSFAESKVINLTAITMSPHVGTHADAPVHVQGDMAEGSGMAASLPLENFIGPAVVFDVSPLNDAIGIEHVAGKLKTLDRLPARVLFKTCREIRYEVFEDRYAYFSVELVQALADRGVTLMGIDTPSVDDVNSKTLDAHHALIARGLCWLENLDLTRVEEGEYVLVAPPLKLAEVEASPVRAVLLEGDGW
ncbi:MAG TPA: cyclase family protein [Candidatus Obscuribacterales bacterium]